jgi:hypothetical protein
VDNQKQCDACKELIHAEATKCPKCQTVLVAAAQPSSGGLGCGSVVGSIIFVSLLAIFWQWWSPILLGLFD